MARRRRSGTLRRPPDHQLINAPPRPAAATTGTAEREQAPRPLKPKAAKTETRDKEDCGTEERTRASAPTEQPTTRRAEDPERTDETTEETSGCADTGSERDPQKPTEEKDENMVTPMTAKTAEQLPTLTSPSRSSLPTPPDRKT